MPTHPHSTLPTTAYPSPLREEEAAAAAGTISYEVMCAVSARVPRIYR